ncbi:MAG: tetratricopeptide repeat protein [Acidobacteria bacterium]|jgi:serine/threonine protein kinase/predicted TPR repeat methyltransferase|nr:tetratricopeptide repeat protein [Acidobacteriota bacterium]
MSEKTPRRDPYRLVGEIFNDRYTMDEFIVLGSFGAVYRATDQKLGRIVAVKILKPDLKEDVAEEARELFQREARAAGALNHPHIVSVTDVGEDFGIAYLVMEWLEGRTLEQELRQYQQISLSDTKVILEQITGALNLAHVQNIVHRDIKPSNIHLGKSDEIFVKVLDFGIAKVTTSAANAVASRIAGTFAYMPPEQIEGKIIDARTDIYALGILLFQMLSGKLPFEKKSEEYLIQQQITAKPPRLTDFSPEFNPAVADVIERALAKNPADRQQSVIELYESFISATQTENTVEGLSGEIFLDEEEIILKQAENNNSHKEEISVIVEDTNPEPRSDEKQQASALEANLSNSPANFEIEVSENKADEFLPKSIIPITDIANSVQFDSKPVKIWRFINKYQVPVIGVLLILLILVGWFAVSSYKNYQSNKFTEHLLQGANFLDKKQYDATLNEFDQAVNINSDSAEAFKGRADAYHFKGESEKAVADYTEAINLGLKDAEIYRRRGYNQKAVLNFDKAIADYSEAIEINPNDSASYSGRCQTYLENRQFDIAMIDCNRAIELSPDNANSYISRGNLYLSKNENNLAIADFNQALKLQSDNAAAFLGRGNANYNKGDYGKALVDFSDVIRLESQNPAAYSLRGLLYQKKQNYDKAIADFTEAIRLNPEFPLLYASRGKSFLMKKEYDEAIDDYTNAIKFNNGGKAADFYFERGIAYYEKKEYDKAINDWTEVINLDPKSYGAYQNRGAAYEKQGKRQLAEADFRKERELRSEK